MFTYSWFNNNCQLHSATLQCAVLPIEGIRYDTRYNCEQQYSGTSLNGHFLCWTPHWYRTKCCDKDWICIMHNTLQLSKVQTLHYSVKRTDFAVLLIPGLYKNSLNNADAGRPLTQDCPAPLIDSPTGLTLVHNSSSLCLSFLAIVQQGSSETRIHSAQWHEYALPHLPEIYQKPPN